MNRLALLICLLSSLPFSLAQDKSQPQTPESQQGDRKVSSEQVLDDSVQLMRQDVRSQRKQTEEQMAQLRLRWIPEFEKVISPKKTAMYFQIDRRLGLMVELKLSSESPLAKP